MKPSRRVFACLALFLAPGVSSWAQTTTCTLEALGSGALFAEAVVQEIGAHRFTCPGLGAGPFDLRVFFDGAIVNRSAPVNNRNMTSAIAYVEGTTPETAVFQVPGAPRAQGANVFFLEFVEDRIGRHLFATGLPTGRPIIIEGVEVDVAAQQLQRIVAAGGGLGFNASAVQGNRVAIGEAELVTLEILNGVVDVTGSLTNPDGTARVFGLEFVPAVWSLAQALRSELVEKARQELDFLKEELERIERDRTLMRFILVLWGVPIQPQESAPPAAVVRLLERIERIQRALGEALQPARQSLPGSLHRVVDFDPETLLGGRLAEEGDPMTLAVTEEGVGVAIYEFDADGADVLEEFEIPLEIDCATPAVLNGQVVLRSAFGPTTSDQVERLLDFRPPATLGPAKVGQALDDLPAPTFVGEVYEHTFEFVNFACGGAPSISAVTHAASFAVGAVAPEMIVSIFGLELANQTVIANTVPLPTTLGGSTFTVTDSGGAERDMSLFFVSGMQVNGLIPAGTALGAATLTATTGQGVAAASLQIGPGDEGPRQTGDLPLEVAPIVPGLFAANASGQGVAAALALRIKADDSRTTEPLFDANLQPVPLDLGDTDQVFLLLFGTGIRGFSSEVRVTVGGEDVPVLGALPQGEFVGLDQVNVGPLPRTLIGRGEVPIELTADGQAANTVTVNVR